jgi:aryl-alcohol dehydrogenase-like predicted oxidoreductase
MSTNHDVLHPRTLGKAGPRVSAIGFGAMVLTPGIYGDVTDIEAQATLNAAVDVGINFVDTARMYGSGANELLIGNDLGSRRHEIVLATKGGITGNPPNIVVDGTPAALRSNVEASLKALQTDYIDIYYLHSPDFKVPVEESYRAMAEFVKEGKVRHLGVSNFTIEQIKSVHQIHPICASQDQYSLLWRRPEQEGRVQLLKELGIALVAYSPLANGALAGAALNGGPNDMRGYLPRFGGDEGVRIASLAKQFNALAHSLGTTPAALALAWLLHQGNHIIPIPGSRKAKNLVTNQQAASISLSPSTLLQLDQLFPLSASMLPMF